MAADTPERTFRQFHDRVRMDERWRTAQIASGHAIHREQPDLLIELLETVI